MGKDLTERAQRTERGAIPFLARGAVLLVVALFVANSTSTPQEASQHYYLGFDRNIYPGDKAMKLLRKTFAFTSYWLSPPPGEKENTWSGKRALLRSQGFGFLVLCRGPQSNELQSIWSESPKNYSGLKAQAEKKATADARRAAAAAKKEGFLERTIVFLDIEEGGRLTSIYHGYLRAWADELAAAGYRAGVYCSGMPVSEGAGTTIITADDIRNNIGAREVVYWVYNDACPPSPGCAFPQNPPAPSKSGIAYVQVWQFVRSPRDKQTARHCRGYVSDGNCYAPSDTAHEWFLDVNSATSPDPSGGAK